MRLFIAVPLPKTVRDSIDAYIYEAEQKVSASWANAKNLHLTLAFLGDIPEEQLPAIQSAMDAIAETPAFTLDLDTVGCFPDQRLPRIIWLGPSHPPYDMGQLAKSLREKLARQHIPFDNKPFIPHITIARDPVNPTLGIPLQLPDFTENLEVPIDEIMLFESRLTQPEATYVTMYRTRLG